MVEIKKVTDPRVLKEIYAAAAITPQPGDRVIATLERGSIVNSAVFQYEKENGSLRYIDGFGGDLALLDGLCRAILNIMEINRVKEVYLPIKYKKLANLEGFQRRDNGYYLSLNGFFNCKCTAKGESQQ